MNPDINKYIGREFTVILICLFLASIFNAYLLRIVPAHPNLLLGYIKVFLLIFALIIAGRFLFRIIVLLAKR